jgi:WD40 repeat protein
MVVCILISSRLSAARRKRKTPAALVDGEKRMAGFTVAKLDTSHAGGSPTSKNGGIIVFQSFQGTLFENEVVLLAGGSKDGKITIRRMEGAGESTQILTSKAHKKDVTALAWGVDGTLLTGGVDGKVIDAKFLIFQIKTWLVSEGKKDITWKEIKAHALDTPILSLSIHPSGKLYLACTSTSWILIDIETGDVIATVDAKNESGIMLI